MLIKVRVTTESKKESFVKVSEDHFNIAVREPAEENRANDRIIKLLSEQFPGKSLKIIKGHHSPSKIIKIG